MPTDFVDSSQYSPAASPAFEAIDENGGARWYVVQTHQNSESLAERHLAAQNFRAYLPKRRRTIRHARSTMTVCSAYFECYLFVSLDIQRQRWYPINSTAGVRKLIMRGSTPVPAHHGVVETLISATDDSGILRPQILLQPGQTIRVVSGPFSDQLGTLDQVGRDGAVRVLLNIMKRSVPIRIDKEQVVVVSDL